jgi:hypothetical protein
VESAALLVDQTLRQTLVRQWVVTALRAQVPVGQPAGGEAGEAQPSALNELFFGHQSHRHVADWGEVFGDPVVATAILDRHLHHSHVLTIRGDSYRLREKRRSGLIRPSAPTPSTTAEMPG